MSQAEVEGFLARNPLCRLGCLDEEGWPYVVPVWYQYRDGGFYIVSRSAWAGYIKREPRWLLFVRPDKTTTWQGVDWAARYKHGAW